MHSGLAVGSQYMANTLAKQWVDVKLLQFPTCLPLNGLFGHWSRGWGVFSFSEHLVLFFYAMQPNVRDGWQCHETNNKFINSMWGNRCEPDITDVANVTDWGNSCRSSIDSFGCNFLMKQSYYVGPIYTACAGRLHEAFCLVCVKKCNSNALSHQVICVFLYQCWVLSFLGWLIIIYHLLL